MSNSISNNPRLTVEPKTKKLSPKSQKEQTFIVLATKFAPYLDKFFRSFTELQGDDIDIINASEVPDLWETRNDYLSEILRRISSHTGKNENEEDEDLDITLKKRATEQKERIQAQKDSLATIPEVNPDAKSKHIFVIQDEKLDEDPELFSTEDAELKGLYHSIERTPNTLSFLYLHQRKVGVSKQPRDLNHLIPNPNLEERRGSLRKKNNDAPVFTLTPNIESLPRINLTANKEELLELRYYARRLIGQIGKYQNLKFNDFNDDEKNFLKEALAENIQFQTDHSNKIKILKAFINESKEVSAIASSHKLKARKIYQFIVDIAFGRFLSASTISLNNKLEKLNSEQAEKLIAYLKSSGLILPKVFLASHITKLAYDLFGIKLSQESSKNFIREKSEDFKSLLESYQEPHSLVRLRQDIVSGVASQTYQVDYDSKGSRHSPNLTNVTEVPRPKSFDPNNVRTTKNTSPGYLINPTLHSHLFSLLDKKNKRPAEVTNSLLKEPSENPITPDLDNFHKAYSNPFSTGDYNCDTVRNILYTALIEPKTSNRGKALRDPGIFDIFIRHLERSCPGALKISPEMKIPIIS